MKQLDLYRKLGITLPRKNIYKYTTLRGRLMRGDFCKLFNDHMKISRDEMIKQISMIINENCIDLNLLKEYGLIKTISSDCFTYRLASINFENQILSKHRIKEKVIDNMLYAINLIDYYINNTN